MKQLLLLKNYLCLILLLDICQISFGQLPPPFANLSTNGLETGIFYPKANAIINPPSSTNYDAVSTDDSRQLYYQFDRAHNSESGLTSWSDLEVQLNSTKKGHAAIPIVIMDYKYDDIKADAAINGDIFSLDNNWFNNPLSNESPFEVKQTLVVHIAMNKYICHTQKFILRSNQYFTNLTLPDLIEIDFDDGLGFRIVQFEQVLEVTYSNSYSNRIIKVRVTRNDQEKKGAGILRGGGSEYESPFPFPKPSNGAELNLDEQNGVPFLICAIYNNQEYCANAFTLWSDDNVLDKPFIFVEGVDFSYDHEPLRNGDFGWYQFSSGLDPDYDFVQEMPVLLNRLREENYDIILVDFFDGAAYIEGNAEILIELIQRVNSAKEDQGEPNVIAGASMGGQVTKFALSTMEKNGIKHCTRTWISLDSPHNGAYIPIGLQDMFSLQIDHSPHPEKPIKFKQDYLERPAAREMLYLQTFGQSLYNDFYNKMAELGFPKLTRNLGISDGNGDGVGLNFSDGNYMLNWQCALGDIDLGRLRIGAIPGISSHPENSGFNKVTAEFRFSQPFPNFYTIFQVETHWIKRNLSNIPNYDHMPGGKRKSIQQFAEAANEVVPSACPIESGNYKLFHCFVPTASALGMAEHGYWTNFNQLWLTDPDLFPFDDVWMAPNGTNLRHSEVTSGDESNIEFILKEVLNGQNNIVDNFLSVISPNNGLFNYGLKGDKTLYDVTVTNGGRLMLNSNALTHYQTIDDGAPDRLLLKMNTSECGAVINVQMLGAIELGDIDGVYTSELTLRSLSTMTIGNNGSLKIFPNSKLIIEDGAELIIYPTANLRIESGSIIVKAGGKITVLEGVTTGETCFISLLNSNSAIVFDDGELHIAANTSLEIIHDGFDSGYIEFAGNNEEDIFLGDNSVFKLVGDGHNDVMLKINNYHNMRNGQDGQGGIVMESCKVDLSNHGGICTDLKMNIYDVIFEDGQPNGNSDEGGYVQVWNNNTCIFFGCDFEHADLKTYNTHLVLNGCNFNHRQSGVECQQGYFLLNNCSFESCHIESNGLDQFSSMANSVVHADNFGLIDESLVEIRIFQCEFNELNMGVRKTGGILSLKCCLFQDIYQAAVNANYSALNLSSDNAAGYNNFNGVGTCIELMGANELRLNHGYNNLSGYSDCCICGTMTGDFLKQTELCDGSLRADNNYWGAPGNTFPPSPQIQGVFNPSSPEVDINVYFGPCNSYCNIQGENGWQMGCRMNFYDYYPAIPTGCGTSHTFPHYLRSYGVMNEGTEQQYSDRLFGIDHTEIRELRNLSINPDNPVLNTVTFNDMSLDSALVIAASQMEICDSLGSDAVAVELFHEILSSPLDRTNSEIRRKMEWGRYNMKSAMECMFLTDELHEENNIATFEPAVALYVDVLNAMTDTILTDSTYQSQFYLELDKGQLFRTLNNPLMAKHIYMHLDDCQLDSTEQALLNNWRAEVDLELSLYSQSVIQYLPPDSMNFEVDTTAYTPAIPYSPSDYYFGLWIDSPSSVTFVNCGNNPVYRSGGSFANSFVVYPNPTNGAITIEAEQRGMYNLEIFDVSGRSVLKTSLNMEESMRANLQLPSSMAKGNYVIKLENSNGIYIDRLIKQ